jgi:hypothetical protein
MRPNNIMMLLVRFTSTTYKGCDHPLLFKFFWYQNSFNHLWIHGLVLLKLIVPLYPPSFVNIFSLQLSITNFKKHIFFILLTMECYEKFSFFLLNGDGFECFTSFFHCALCSLLLHLKQKEIRRMILYYMFNWFA